MTRYVTHNCQFLLKKQGRIHGTRCAWYAFENNAGQTDLRTYGRTYGRTDTPSYRDATAHLKRIKTDTEKEEEEKEKETEKEKEEKEERK